MKILMIEDFFHPQAGYQLNVLCPYLVKFGHDVTIICGEMELFPDYLTSFFGKDNISDNDDKFTRETGVNIIRVPVKKYISGRAIFDNSIYENVEKQKPDIIYVHGNDTFTGMQFILKQAKFKVPLISDTHMVELASNNRFAKIFRWGYKNYITPKIKKYNNFVIRTVEDPFVMKWYNIPEEQAPVIGFGSDTLRFQPSCDMKTKMRKELGVDDNDIVVIYAGKLDEYKGGSFLATAIKDKFDLAEISIKFLIIGNVSGEKAEETSKLLEQSNNIVIRRPTQPYPELAKWFQAADVAVFPKQCSLTYYDVLACGLPVLVEDNPIGLQRAKECEAASTFKAGDVGNFRKRLSELVCSVAEERKKTSEDMSLSEKAIRYIKENYDYEKQARRYEEVILKVIENYNKSQKG